MLPVAATGAEREAAAKPEQPPLIGYNDDFNRFELHRRNDPDEILPPIELPIELPIDLRCPAAASPSPSRHERR